MSYNFNKDKEIQERINKRITVKDANIATSACAHDAVALLAAGVDPTEENFIKFEKWRDLIIESNAYKSADLQSFSEEQPL